MDAIKQQIFDRTAAMRQKNEDNEKLLAAKTVMLTDYLSYCDIKDGYTVWTEAFRRAIAEGNTVIVPASSTPYVIDDTLVLPSDRMISAYGATIKQAPGMRVIMMRNEHTADGTHAPVNPLGGDHNIVIAGGTWEENCPARMGYGRSGMYDKNRSFFGVSACMFFNHMEGLTIRDVTFCHCGGFAVQIGDIRQVSFNHITFDTCYADGLHINGNTECVYIGDVHGYVGDDLVALNMYDWQNSSVDFGPMTCIWCEGLRLSENSPYKAMRIEPGIYTFDNGEIVDCSACDIVIRDVKGIQTYKLYFQTPSYVLGESPEQGDVGSGTHIFFEDIDIDLVAPIDGFDNYMNGDPVTGSFAAFEIGANIERISLENIRLRIDKERFPMGFLLCVGPKSAINGEGKEAFDPYLSSRIERVELRDITVNGERLTSPDAFVHEIVFDHIYPECPLLSCGEIGRISLMG